VTNAKPSGGKNISTVQVAQFTIAEGGLFIMQFMGI